MPLILLLAIALGLAACRWLALRDRRRTPPELRGDWWPQFEAEFRAYAEPPAADESRRATRNQPPSP